jgi:glycosyltransferase involved in cell wall biosynthesis
VSPHVVLISAEPLTERMTGPAIRMYELARTLAPYASVTLVSPRGAEPAPDRGFPLVTYSRADPRPLEAVLTRATAIVAQPPWPHVAAAIRRSGARFVADLYDPEPFELLESLSGRSSTLRRVAGRLTLDRIRAALDGAHHLMCASEKQRDLWLGALLGSVSPEAYDVDPSLRERIDVVPFGVPAEPPVRRGGGPREGDEELVLWNGGIWNWLDVPTAIRAVAALRPRRPRLRLHFMGGAASGQAARATAEAKRLAAEMDFVHFHDGWVPYEARADWLLDADVAISTHLDHLESRFAFRTRLLDCLWARLPIVCTGGDALAERVEREELGAVVAPGDHEGASAALERVLDRGKAAYGPALARSAAELSWERAAAPLIRWVTSEAPPPARRVPRNPRDYVFRAALRATGRRWWPTL